MTPDAMPWTLRELAPADAPDFQRLRLQGLLESPSAFSSSHEEECDRPFDEVARRLAADADGCVFGGFVDGWLVGLAGVRREHGRKLAHKAFIWGVYVAPAARGTGLARALLQAALARAAAMPGLRQVNLGVHASNEPARRLYESLGFVAFGLERGYQLLDGVLHDELHMVKVLER